MILDFAYHGSDPAISHYIVTPPPVPTLRKTGTIIALQWGETRSQCQIMDGRYQVHYLPASPNCVVNNKLHLFITALCLVAFNSLFTELLVAIRNHICRTSSSNCMLHTVVPGIELSCLNFVKSGINVGQ